MARNITIGALGWLLGLAVTLAPLAADAQQQRRTTPRRQPAPRTARRDVRSSGAQAPAAARAANRLPIELPASTTEMPEDVEPIQERDDDGHIRVERYVTQDAEGNYINHGPWTQFNTAGQRVGTGEFFFGQRQGKWVRLFAAGEAPIVTSELHKQFQAPFVSEATLVDDQLHGTWTIYDARNLKVSEWEFENGVRSGKSIWYYPNGMRAREADYLEGKIDGKLLAWDPQERLVQDDTYFNGRKHASKTLNHEPGKKKAEGWVLYAEEPVETAYDWINGTIATTPLNPPGVDEKHGLWTWWYPNGQKYSEGRYLNDAPVGLWVFWHSNGQKQMEGEYAAGTLAGKWTWWKEDGSVLRAEDYGQSAIGDDGGEPELLEAPPEDSAEADLAPTLEDEPDVDLEASDESETDDLEEPRPIIGRLRMPALR